MNIFKSYVYMLMQIVIGMLMVVKVMRNKVKVGEIIYMGLRIDFGI